MVTSEYWRGFRACLIMVVLPLIVVLVVSANVFVNNNIEPNGVDIDKAVASGGLIVE